ncbi:MAG: response regulator transcription factor, partial [Dorea sp.]|nr:response regulator transcription factor [Dorea sp.]
MVDNYLVSEDFRVNVFHSGFEAIRAFQSNSDYALALIDLMLPDTSGMEVIKAIRQISKVPIIIITAKDNDTDKSMGLNLGADDYVVKPFSL